MALNTRLINQSKPIFFFFLILPSFIWFYQYIVGNLGINPIDILTDKLGEFSLQLIITTLFLSSLSKFKYLRSLQILRRMFGLFAFYYVSLHFLTYIVLDHFFHWNMIIKDIFKRPFITFGFVSFLLLFPLVFTSKNSIIKKLKYNLWKKIHRLIYIVAPLATLHYFLLTKGDKTKPIIYFIIIFILFFWRIKKKINIYKKN